MRDFTWDSSRYEGTALTSLLLVLPERSNIGPSRAGLST
jgi:hypothetical protein